MAPIQQKALINCDMGEAYGNWTCGPDLELLPMIDIANIACGFHGGDPLIMMETVRHCKAHNVRIGAHPGLPDLQGFGRREMKLSPEELTAITIYQVGALQGFLDREGVPLHHVKPHGVLYGMMCRDYEVAKAVMLGIPKGVPVFGLAGTQMEKAANDLGIEFWAELYGDVKYDSNGMLVIDRKKKPWNLADVEKHVRQQVEEQSVTAVDGTIVQLPLKTYPVSICCHSDSPGCVDIIRTTRKVPTPPYLLPGTTVLHRPLFHIPLLPLSALHDHRAEQPKQCPSESLKENTPSPPAWGTLPLDIYLLSEWDTPHSSYLADSSQTPVPESPSDRRNRLIRQFLALGSAGRQPYQSQTETPPTPTDIQINETLRPARPESLQPYAEYTGSLVEGLYLGLCYDADKEEAHKSLWSQNLDAAFVGPDGIIFDDKELFGGEGINLARFLETFPERVTNVGSVAHFEHRERVLRDTLRRIQEDGGNTETEGEDGFSEEVKNPLLQYGEYHAACVVTHLFIEDEQAPDGNGLLHVFLDDTGNVIRHWRTDDEGGDHDFDGT